MQRRPAAWAYCVAEVLRHDPRPFPKDGAGIRTKALHEAAVADRRHVCFSSMQSMRAGTAASIWHADVSCSGSAPPEPRHARRRRDGGKPADRLESIAYGKSWRRRKRKSIASSWKRLWRAMSVNASSRSGDGVALKYHAQTFEQVEHGRDQEVIDREKEAPWSTRRCRGWRLRFARSRMKRTIVPWPNRFSGASRKG